MNGILLNQGGAGAVDSVNGQTGEVTLTLSDIDNNKIIKTDNENFTASGSMFTFKVTPGGLDYSASLNTCCSFDISQNGLEVTGDPSFLDEDIILNQVAWKDENQQEVIITTHKLSEKANIADVYNKDYIDEYLDYKQDRLNQVFLSDEEGISINSYATTQNPADVTVHSLTGDGETIHKLTEKANQSYVEALEARIAALEGNSN